MTLVELVVSLALFGIVVLSAFSVEVVLRRVSSSGQGEATLNNEAAAILTLLSKDIEWAVGSVYLWAYNNTPTLGNPTYRFRRDTNQAAFLGIPDVGDRCVYYVVAPNPDGSFRLLYYPISLNILCTAVSPGGTPELLSNHLVGLVVTDPSILDASGSPVGYSNVTLTMRRRPAQPMSETNPQLIQNATIGYRSASF